MKSLIIIIIIMNSAIANLLNKLFGVWIENLNSEQLKLSIFSGKIYLKDVWLKRDFLDLLGLPFHLVYGKADIIEVKIPWSSWNSSPLEIQISDISIFLSPISTQYWSEQREQESVMKIKKYYLEHFEVMNPDDLDANSEEGYAGILTTNLIDNLQLTIKNLYIRYEDNINSNEPFAIGICIKEIYFYTCNSLWESEVSKNSSICYKLFQLVDFSIFLDYDDGIVQAAQWYDGDLSHALISLIYDEINYKIFHKYIIFPTSFRTELTLNKDPDNVKLPPISINLVTDNLKMQLFTLQVDFLIDLKKFVNNHYQFKKSIELSTKDRGFALDEVHEYRKVYMEYRKLNKIEEIATEQKEIIKTLLDQLERDIFIEDIKIQRNAVITDIKLEKI